MKAEVIREIVHSTFEARNGVTLKRYEHIADDEVRALTYNIHILEQAGFVVLPKEELEAALKPFGSGPLPSSKKTEIAFDRHGLRRSMSPLEIARLNAERALTPKEKA